MIEALFEAIIAVFVGIFQAIASAFELLVGLFSSAGLGEAIIGFFALIAEFLFWGLLWIIELIFALFLWRKPKKVKRRKFYSKKDKAKIEDKEES